MKRKPRDTSMLRTQMETSVIDNNSKVYVGNTANMISTGSTLLDLAISGTRIRGGGLPVGILVEVFGPNSAGKTVLLSEIAGATQRTNGSVLFQDPEARFDAAFAQLFDFDITNAESVQTVAPDTVTDMFHAIYEWEPTGDGVHGIFTDSLAALSTNLEMGAADGDKMGMRRAKEFSEGFRKLARVLKQRDYLMVCSNQIREKPDVRYGEKFTVPGGKAIGFYASVRLRMYPPEKEYKTIKVAGKDFKKVIANKVKVLVYKNSTDVPYREALIYINFDYGIDDIRANLQFIKDYTRNKTYTLNGQHLDNAMSGAITIIEENAFEDELREEVIDLWELIQRKFKHNRKKKIRWE